MRVSGLCRLGACVAVLGLSFSSLSAEAPIEATIKVTKISKPLDPVKDSAKVDYKEALLHIAAVFEDGAKKGEEVGVRFWVMNERKLIGKATSVKVGDSFKVKLKDWNATIKEDKKLGQYVVYNDTDQDLLVPIYFVVDGELGPKSLLK